jgi:NAD(P)H dehydrogenase (quinone)
MTIAVTAATGALGTHVVNQLIDQLGAESVVALVRNPQKASAFAERGVDVRPFDYSSDVDTLSAQLAGVDSLLLISGNELGQRAAQHKTVIDAAKQAGVAFVAYTSVLNADHSTNPVTGEHLATEQYLAQAGVAYSFLRNGWYNENYLSSVDTARQSHVVLTSAGDGRVASAARADYAAAAVTVLTSEQREVVYELSGDTAWSQADLAAAVAEVIGDDVAVAAVDAAAHREALVGFGLDNAMADFVVGIDTSIEAGDLASTPGQLSNLIGRPTTPLIESLRG